MDAYGTHLKGKIMRQFLIVLKGLECEFFDTSLLLRCQISGYGRPPLNGALVRVFS